VTHEVARPVRRDRVGPLQLANVGVPDLDFSCASSLIYKDSWGLVQADGGEPALRERIAKLEGRFALLRVTGLSLLDPEKSQHRGVGQEVAAGQGIA